MPAMAQEGTIEIDPMPGFTSLSAAPDAVFFAVLAVLSVPPLAFVPVTVASAEDTVTACCSADLNVHVKVSPLTGVEITPPTLDIVFVPLLGMLLGW